jgi:hypothetical protein
MPGKYMLDTLSIAANQIYFDAIIAYRNGPHRHFIEGIAQLCDSIRASIADAVIPEPQYREDITALSSEFIIGHIDRSFEIRQEYPQSGAIPFDLFCNYVLPYNAHESYWEGAASCLRKYIGTLPDTVASSSAVELGKYIDNHIRRTYFNSGGLFQRYSFLQPLNFRNVVEAWLGECLDMAGASITAVRSFGIPAALNSLPLWGNSNGGHFWTEIVRDTVWKRYNNVQRPYVTEKDIPVSDMFWHNAHLTSFYADIPSYITIRECRTVPKIFRYNYAIQQNSLAFLAKEEIPSFFSNPCLEDITSKYMECTDVEIELEDGSLREFAYLCCYNHDNESWVPVDWAAVKHQKAVFHNVGFNVLYLPAIYMGRRIRPVGAPFILKENGEKEILKANMTARQQGIFYSKVPYRTHVLFGATFMLGGRFQLANRPDMSDTLTIHRVDQIPFYAKEVEVSHAPLSRYAIYQFEGLQHGFIAEMEFWGLDEHGREVKLEGKRIGNPGIYGCRRETAFDNDRVSFFQNTAEGQTWIGLDFGVPRRVTKIKYCPRSDDNGIVPGELYELYCWDDNGWTSLGRQTGGDHYKLVYDNVPLNALLRLHNHTRGKEHRPFTCDHDKQIWW